MGIACVTGATSGIGKEFAKYLGRLGYDLILVARRTDLLQEISENLKNSCYASKNSLKHIKVKCITCDLSDETACMKLGKTLKKYNIDILINNAGFGELGAFYETQLKNDLNMVNVNIKALHILTKAVLPDMIRKDYGFIMNVASSAGLLPAGPYMPTYYATKAYVTSLTTAIHHELKDAGSNVHVSMLCPGPVNTGFNDVANVKFSLKGIPADYCAVYALRNMFAGKLTIVPTITMKLAVIGGRLLPRSMSASITAKQQIKKG